VIKVGQPLIEEELKFFRNVYPISRSFFEGTSGELSMMVWVVSSVPRRGKSIGRGLGCKGIGWREGLKMVYSGMTGEGKRGFLSRKVLLLMLLHKRGILGGGRRDTIL